MTAWRCPRYSRWKFLTVCLVVALLYLLYENAMLKVRINSLEFSNRKCAVRDNQLALDNSQQNVNNENEIISNIIKDRAKEQEKVLQFTKTLSGLDRTTAKSDREAFASDKLSIIIYDKGGIIPTNGRLKQLRSMFPKSTFFWNERKDSNLSTTLNNVIPKLTTKYFLFLEPNVIPSDRAEEDVASLWNALEKYPRLDLVGGSYLAENKLHVQCSRYRLCRWTFSESYEYVRFLDNIMICDGISSSFMARTSSIQKISLAFDPKINDVVVLKDFFYRAKSHNLMSGTRPSMMFLTSQHKSLYQLWTSRAVTEELVSFAVKYKVLIFKDSEGKLIELCSPSSPLSGKGLCIEKNSHELLLDGGHWAFKGLYAYSYLYQYLVTTLLEVTDHLDRHNVSYFIDGGVSLGAIKMHSVLPWDSGDVDVLVFGLNGQQIYDLFEPLQNQKGYVVRLMSNPEQVHVFCTPKNVGDLSGGIATIFPGGNPEEIMKIKTNGKWISYKRTLFTYLINTYGEDKFLGHSMYGGSETMECKIKGHNACMPNFKAFFDGKGGTAREYFCEI